MGRMTDRVLPAAAVVTVVGVLTGAGAAVAASGEDPTVPLSATCEDSKLSPHTGFQVGPACVDTEFGEVGKAEDNPQLLIVRAPEQVEAGKPFTIQVSTRNLVRDRFLAAGDGGYYVERGRLDENGIVRGDFHTACRVLDGSGDAPEPLRNDIFVATEDNGGGAAPDTVTVQIPGIPTAGQAQCASWAGDGSHRMPLMQFANQIPAFDAVRIEVTAAADGGAAGSPTPTDGAAPAGVAAAGGQASAPARGQAEAPARDRSEAPARGQQADAPARDRSEPPARGQQSSAPAGELAGTPAEDAVGSPTGGLDAAQQDHGGHSH